MPKLVRPSNLDRQKQGQNYHSNYVYFNDYRDNTKAMKKEITKDHSCSFCSEKFYKEIYKKLHEGICAQNPANNSILKRFVDYCVTEIRKKDFRFDGEIIMKTNQFEYSAAVKTTITGTLIEVEVKCFGIHTLSVATESSCLEIDLKDYFNDLNWLLTDALQREWIKEL